jgi:hypothetical protein
MHDRYTFVSDDPRHPPELTDPDQSMRHADLTQINFANWTDPDRSMRHADFDADQIREHPRCLVLRHRSARRQQVAGAVETCPSTRTEGMTVKSLRGHLETAIPGVTTPGQAARAERTG